MKHEIDIYTKALKDLEITGQVEVIKTTASLKSARILISLGDLMRLAVSQIPMKDHLLTLM